MSSTAWSSDIRDGTVDSGMLARIPLDEGGHLGVLIVGIELVDGPDGSAHLALRLATDDSDEDRAVKAQCRAGRTNIVERNGGAP